MNAQDVSELLTQTVQEVQTVPDSAACVGEVDLKPRCLDSSFDEVFGQAQHGGKNSVPNALDIKMQQPQTIIRKQPQTSKRNNDSSLRCPGQVEDDAPLSDKALALLEGEVNDAHTQLYDAMGNPQEGMEDTEDDTDKSAWGKMLEAALAANKVDPQSAIMGRLKRCHSEFHKYQKLHGTKAKSAFRLEFAKEQMNKEHAQRGSKRQKEWRKFDVEKGTYMPLTKIFMEEGGQVDPKGALKATANYAARCGLLGGPWIMWNAMTQRKEYLYVTKGYKHEFGDTWSIFEEHCRQQREKRKSDALVDRTVDRDKTPLSKKAKGTETGSAENGSASKAKNRKKDKKNPHPEVDDETAKAGKKVKSALATAMQSARSVKALYESNTGQAAQLQNTIATVEAWRWADNEPMLFPLKAALKEVEDSVNSMAFVREYLVGGDAYVRRTQKDSDEDTLAHELVEFVKIVKPKVDKVTKAMKRLKNMHAHQDD